MALVPSRQFYPTTTTTTTAFLDSFQSKFHGTPLHFLKYNPSSIPLKNLTFTLYATHNYFSSNPKKPTNKNPISPHNNNTWLHNWNKPHHQNLPKAPPFAFNYRNNNSHNITSNGGGGGGGGGGSTMDKIVEKLKKFGYVDEGEDKKEKNPDRVIEKGSVEDIFYVEEGMLPNTRGGFSKESPLGDDKDVMFPWEKPRKVGEEEKDKWTARKKSRTSLAELTLPESELRRLKNMMFLIKNKTKVGGAGVTRKVVDAIHEKWKTSEIVRVKVEGDPALNMKRMHEILERKTGGLVIWRSGTSVTLYRGVSYEVPSVQLNKRIFKRNEISPYPLPTATDKTIRDPLKFSSYKNVDAPLANPETTTEAEAKRDRERMSVVNYEEEVDQLLDCLGPRYTDWSGLDPLPVDADMLPGIVPGYQPPLRVLPYGVRSTIGQKEATALRRLARILPPHFALGRSRQLQGLAVAMIKLWERSLIAKIALKRGVQLTTSERMAEELKKLTGGMLLSRNKDFLVFYRGKNFLSPDVTEALQERERLAKSLQDEEEQARLRASAFFVPSVEIPKQAGTAGTLGETLDADARWGKRLDDRQKEEMMREAEVVRHANLFRKLERKLAFAERKLMKAERALSKVEEFLKPTEQQADPESITDEERFMFRKLGLRMKAFLLLGRRGVFDGTVENMHLHWKYRELIKILVKAKSFEQVKKVALALEAESGGVLVSVDKVSKGYAIIVYRGKDYQRPSKLRPKNLLTKRKALARSIELQRREALLNHISAVQTKVDKLRAEIEQMDIVKDRGDEELYDKLDSAYPTDDEDAEEEGDEAYLETYDGENDGKDESDDLIHNFHLETNFPYHDQRQSEIESVRNKLDSAHPTDDEDTEQEGGDGVYLETYDSENDGEGENHDSIHNFHLETNFTYHDKHQSETES